MPPNRLRAYDMRHVIETMADDGSFLEIRKGFGHGMITAFIRVEGRPIGVVANNPLHLAGAIDSPAADKGARFMQLCDAHDIPLAVPLRHARQHGRPGAREDRAGPPLLPVLSRRRQRLRADLHHGDPQGLRTRRARHGWRQLPRFGLCDLMADR